MPRFEVLTIIAVVLAVSLQQALALKCWDCDGMKDPNCNNNPFDATKMNVTTSFVDCVPKTRNDKATCVKASIGEILARRCVTNEEELNFNCGEEAKKLIASLIKQTSGKDITVSCEMCDTDGCNAGSEFGPVAMMIAIPAIILKVLAF